MIKKTTQMKVKYWDFLLESYLRTSDKLKDILQKVDDPIAKEFLGLIDMDIKTSFNGINIKQGTNDKVTFFPDSQFTNKLPSVSSYQDLIMNAKNSSGIGRVVKGILADNGITVSDRDLEKFVTKFKSVLDSENVQNDRVRVVKGDEIVKWYNQKTYSGKNGGTLWNSCMRHEDCSDYFGIYTENDNVSLVILLDDEDKLLARALFWDNVSINGEDGKKYLDRIYCLKEENLVFLLKWAEDNLKIDFSYQTGDYDGKMLQVKLEKIVFSKYPYIDTFRYGNKSQSSLYSEVESEHDMIFNKTDGSYVDGKCIWSDFHEEYLEEDNAVWSERHNSYLNMDLACYSEWSGDWFTEDEVIYNSWMDDYLWDELELTTAFSKCEWSIVRGLLWKDTDTEQFPKDYSSITKIGSEWFTDDMIVFLNGKWVPKIETIQYVESLDFDENDLSTNADMSILVKSLGIKKIPIYILRCLSTNILHKYFSKLKYCLIEDYVKELEPSDIEESLKVSSKSIHADLFFKIMVHYRPDLLNDGILNPAKEEWTEMAKKYLDDNKINRLIGHLNAQHRYKEIKADLLNILLNPWDFEKHYQKISKYLEPQTARKGQIKAFIRVMLQDADINWSPNTYLVIKCFSLM